MHRQFANVLLQKRVLWQKDLNDFKFPLARSDVFSDVLNIHKLPGLQVKTVSKCTVSVHNMLQVLLALDVHTIRSLPSMYFINTTFAITVLARLSHEMSVIEFLPESLATHSDLKVDLFIEEMHDAFCAAAQGGMCVSASMLLKNLLYLKNWTAGYVSQNHSRLDQMATNSFSCKFLSGLAHLGHFRLQIARSISKQFKANRLQGRTTWTYNANLLKLEHMLLPLFM